jgi:LysM repeat protein
MKTNTPNPLVPQGTLPGSRGTSHVRLAVFTILAVHLVLLAALLMAGCKKTQEPLPSDQTNIFQPPLLEPTTNIFVPPPSLTPAPPPTTSVTPPPTTPVIPPVTPPPVVPPAAEPGREHVVAKGDSFYTLAKKYNTTIKAISDANPGVDSRRLKPGQKLNIPSGTAASAQPGTTTEATTPTGTEKIYTVKSGDTLYQIAKAQGVSVKQIKALNNLKYDQIKVGQKLKIPSKAGAAPAADTSAPVVPAPPPPPPYGTGVMPNP